MINLVSVCLDDMDPQWKIEEKATLTDILILVVHGKAIYVLNEETVQLNKGDLLFISRGVRRAGMNAPEGLHQKYSVHFFAERQEQFPFDVSCSFRKVQTRHLDYMKMRFAALQQHWFGRNPHDGLICAGIALELLGYFSKELVEERFASVKLRLMQEVQDYIRTHYREPIRIDDLSHHIDRAPNYITQTFKDVTGMTPITYLHQVRVYAACDLILNSRMTIGQVSEYLGYSDQAHFNRVFKKIMGYPPSYIQRKTRGL